MSARLNSLSVPTVTLHYTLLSKNSVGIIVIKTIHDLAPQIIHAVNSLEKDRGETTGTARTMTALRPAPQVSDLSVPS